MWASVSTNIKATGRNGRNVVKVENDGGRLRLRFTHAGKRYEMRSHLGYPDSPVNRTVAEGKARQIEGDIATGNFDDTLKKYKPQKTSVQKHTYANASGLFEAFTQEQKRAKGLHAGSLCRYTGTLRHLEKYFQDKPVELISSVHAEDFADYLRHHVSARTAKDYLILVQSCWKWAGVKYGVEPELWAKVLNRVKPAPKQKVKPFTVEEVQAIVTAFKTDRYYHPYADFVSFLFGSGCRFGEVVALKWKHIADDYMSVWIGESVSRGVRKTTKTGKARTVVLTPKIAAMLQARKPADCDSESLVFSCAWWWSHKRSHLPTQSLESNSCSARNQL